MSTEQLPPKKTRGRPTVLDAESVGAIALELWNEHGYENVSWADIARASGVSVRTLTRHFDSKPSLAWVGSSRSTEILTRCLRTMPLDGDVHEALVDAIAESIDKSITIELSGHAWIKAVASIPEIGVTASHAFEPWIEVLSTFVGERLPSLQPFQCVAVAHAYQAATLSAMLHHATSNVESSLVETVRSAIRPLHVVP